MAEYFIIINPAKSQFIKASVGLDQRYDLLTKNDIRLISHLICQSVTRHPLCGSWSRDTIYMAGSGDRPATCESLEPHNKQPAYNMLERAHHTFQNISAQAKGMLADLNKDPGYVDEKWGDVLIVNETKQQYIDPLTFAFPSGPEDLLGGDHGLAIVCLYCQGRPLKFPDGFGAWSGDSLVAARKSDARNIQTQNQTLANLYEVAAEEFENVGHEAMSILDGIAIDFDNNFENRSITNPKLMDQWRLLGLERYPFPVEPDQQKRAVLWQMREAGKRWKQAYAWACAKLYSCNQPYGITEHDVEEAVEQRKREILNSIAKAVVAGQKWQYHSDNPEIETFGISFEEVQRVINDTAGG